MPARAGSRSSRSHGCISTATICRRSASGWPGSPRAASSRSRESSSRSTPPSRPSRSSAARAPSLFHPGKTASTPAGVLGELHPRELDGEWGAFELDLHELFAAAHEPVVYRDVITYPAVRQDIAVAVDEEVAVGDLVAAAREAVGPELREMKVFDVYRGDQVGPDASRSPSRSPSSRPSGRSRRRTRTACATPSSARSPLVSAPSCARDANLALRSSNRTVERRRRAAS